MYIRKKTLYDKFCGLDDLGKLKMIDALIAGNESCELFTKYELVLVMKWLVNRGEDDLK